MTISNEALWRNQGQVLTPELILGILQASMPVPPPSREIVTNYGACAEVKNGITFQMERFSTIAPEVKAQHVAQWEEVEEAREGLCPNYDYVLTCEQQGKYVLFTARRDGKLVGNTGCYLYNSLHTNKPAAKEDTMYVVPEERRGRTAIYFFQYCERQLVKLGAQEITVSTKTSNDVHRLWERQGYTFTDRVLTKTFSTGDEDV